MKLQAQQRKTSQLDDHTIVKRVLDGERDLFELLMRRYNQKLFRVARSYITEPSEAEDVLQEAYVRAYINLKQFHGSSFSAWMARIVANEALGRLRRRHLQPVSDGSTPEATSCELEPAPAPDQVAGRDQMLALIEGAVDHLPLDFRTVFMLRAVEQLSVEETASYLDIKPATVKTRFHRARALLQNKLNRHVDDVAGETFVFGGSCCDRIVASVLDRLDEMI
jgi:RNA polymerase sigma-70 factor (ECF subfamily)